MKVYEKPEVEVLELVMQEVITATDGDMGLESAGGIFNDNSSGGSTTYNNG